MAKDNEKQSNKRNQKKEQGKKVSMDPTVLNPETKFGGGGGTDDGKN
ncbi:hypothetical protein [Salinicoccus sp. Marseille-QA3877]